MNTPPSINRREFLRVSTVTGVGLLIGVYLPGCASSRTPTGEPTATAKPTYTSEPTATPKPTSTLEPTTMPEPAATQRPTTIPEPTTTPKPTTTLEPAATPEPTDWLEPNIYLRIDNNGVVTITAFRSEMGQGVRTAIAMIVAEELDVDWSAVRIEQAPADSAYGDQNTGGSASISRHYALLRRAGATGRQMLVAAAAQEWGVEPESCLTENGWVVHPDGKQVLAYGELVGLAGALPAPSPSDLSYKDPKDFRIVGTRIGHWDAPQIVTGRAVYGIDVNVPEMLSATVARPPVFGGKLVSYDATRAKAVAGVQHVIEISDGLAVVAESTWAAIQGSEALEITWDGGRYADLSSTDIRQSLAERAQPQGESGGEGTLEVAYDVPYLAHATMEPMNCVADVRADRCTVWAPTQNPSEAKGIASLASGIPADAVQVHVTLIGGGFGRRLAVDYVGEAVRISKAVGAPVKLIWTREDDIQHDRYHPLSYNIARANLRGPGPVRTRSYRAPMGVPTGYWRSVTNIEEAFTHECAVDELAAALGRDPYELRLELLPERARPVLELAATKAGWGSPLPDGWGRGMAYHATWGVTFVAQVAEVSVSSDGSVRVHRVVCAIDCGTVINPDTVEAQMEGGIAFGLTACLKGAITIENGRAQQSNFHDYPILRIDEMPVVEVHIMPSDRAPSGVGEMGVPPIIPAVLNAVFAATGKRIRRLPLRAEDLRQA